MCKRATILVMLGLALIGSEAGAKVADDGAEQLRAALQTWRQGDLDGALAQLRESLAVDSRNADTLAWMGEALRRKEEYAEAMAHCRRALTGRVACPCVSGCNDHEST